MENKNIIIILVIVIIILAAAIGVVLFNQATAKDPAVLKITSDNKLDKGKDLSVKLTDTGNRPIQGEIVNVKITDSKGKSVVDDVVKTNSKGIAKLSLDLDEGKYDVNVTYEGNDNFTGTNDTQKLTIKEEEVAQVESTPSQSQPKAYAYKSDGTPMYSQAEVDSYMLNKYGMVNYHLNDNGYVNLDEPGYDDKGNYIGY